MKKKSIRQKILIRMFTICLVALIVSGAIHFTTLVLVGRMTRESSTGDLENQMTHSFSSYVSTKADDLNRQLNNLSAGFSLLLCGFEDVLTYPELYLDVPVKEQKDMQAGAAGLYAFVPKGKSYTDFQDTAQCLASAESSIEIIMRYYPQFIGCGIVTLDGYAMMYDATADKIPADFDLTKRDWFAGALEAEREDREWYSEEPEVAPSYEELDLTAYCTDVYQNLDIGIKIITLSCAARVNGEVVAICYADIDIGVLANQVFGLMADDEGQGEAALFSPELAIVMPERLSGNDMSGLLAEMYSSPLDMDSVTLDNVGNIISLEGGNGSTKAELNGTNYYVMWNTVPITAYIVEGGWKIAYFVPESVVSEPVASSAAKLENAISASEYIGLAAQLIILGCTIGTAFVFAKRLSTPILKLTEDATAISMGDLDRPITVNSGDEIETLGNALSTMIADIKAVTGEKERIGAELSVATNIQASMLPHIFPPFPDKTEIDLFGTMEPAKEVGGDFYDFFLADDDTLVTVIADVSGKGVPAALFMVIAKTLIKNNAQTGMPPKQVFELVNNILCDGNEAGMFVTAFMAYLDLRTGRLTYVNAGHNPPMLMRSGVFDYLAVEPDLFLACMEDVEYHQCELAMEPGDILYLYTDGVTEAVDPSNDLFEEERLKSAINAHAGEDLVKLLHGIRHEIDLFANGAEQADDITMLAVKYNGGSALE